MKLKNTALVIGLALVGAALTAPAGAGAVELWWFDHDQGRFPTTTNPKNVEPSLEFIVIKDKNGKEYGPCEKQGLKLGGQLSNKLGGMGEGSITKVVENKVKECPATATECKVVKLEPLISTPWSLTLQSTSKVLITNFSITLELSGKCTGSGLPGNEVTISGTVDEKKTTFVPFNGENFPEIVFEEAQVGTSGIYLKGSIPFGTELTALKEPKAFSTETEAAKIDANQTASVVFTRAGKSITCEESQLSATVKNGATEATVTPTYSKCSTILGPATIKMNGCDYLLHLKSELVEGETYTYTAPTDLKCPAGKVVEAEVFSSSANHTAGIATCRYTVSEAGNNELGTVKLTNKAVNAEHAKAWMESDFEIKEIESKRVLGGEFLCGPEKETAETLKGTYAVTGTTDTGAKEEAIQGIAVFPG